MDSCTDIKVGRRSLDDANSWVIIFDGESPTYHQRGLLITSGDSTFSSNSLSFDILFDVVETIRHHHPIGPSVVIERA